MSLPLPASYPPSPETAQELELRAVLGLVVELAREGRSPCVLFDLDDTVLSTTRRHLRILREFAAEPSVVCRWPDAAARLSRVEPAPTSYAVADIARSAGLEDSDLLKALKSYWSARFFKSEYVMEDDPVPGAPEYCRRIDALGGSVVYLTGRDESMRPGTVSSLALNGFPMPDQGRTRILFKPSFDVPDLPFKRQALDLLASWGPVAGGFENEPAHVNIFQERFPEGRMVFVETKHSGSPIEPKPGIGRVRDYLHAA